MMAIAVGALAAIWVTLIMVVVALEKINDTLKRKGE